MQLKSTSCSLGHTLLDKINTTHVNGSLVCIISAMFMILSIYMHIPPPIKVLTLYSTAFIDLFIYYPMIFVKIMHSHDIVSITPFTECSCDNYSII